MKSFLQYSAEIKEGGKSLKSVPIVRINKANVLPTIAAVLAKLKPFGISPKDTHPIGSTGKKDSSGDIDCACLYDGLLKKMKTTDKKAALQDLTEKVRGIFGEAFFYFGNQVTFPVPIVNADGKQPDSHAQFDLMFTNDLAGSSFLYHSEEQVTSKYKSVHRNVMMFAIAVHHKRTDLGDGVSERHWFSVQDGMIKGKESGIGSKRKGYDKEILSKDGDAIAKEFLGPSFTKSDAISFEAMWKAIHSPKFVGKKDLAKIIAHVKADYTKMHLEMPRELS